MSAMKNIFLKDDTMDGQNAELTPFEFVPVSDTPFPNWRTQDPLVPLDGQKRLSMMVEKLKSGSYKITVKLESPTMETLGASGNSAGYVAPPKVAYVTTCIFTMFADKRSTIEDRMNALVMSVGLLHGARDSIGTGTLTNDMTSNAWSDYAATSPAMYMFKGLILPN